MGSVKYVEGPADIMRILRYNEYERSDVTVYVEEGFYYDDLRGKPFILTFIPLGFDKYVRIHRDFDDYSVHPSGGRSLVDTDIRKLKTVELPIVDFDDVFREIAFLMDEQANHPQHEQAQIIIDGQTYLASNQYIYNYLRIRDMWKIDRSSIKA